MLLFILILIQIVLKGLSISWQEIVGTHGGDNSRYIGQPGSCFPTIRYSSSQRKCHCGWETRELIYKKSITFSPYLLQLFINYIHKKMLEIPLLWRLTFAVISSLTYASASFPCLVFLFLSLLLREYGYIEYTFLIDFTSWVSNV